MPDIKIISHSGSEVSYPNCLLVHTYPEPKDHSITLTTVEHILSSFDPDGCLENVCPIRIVNAQPISHDEAMELAMHYAEDHSIPAILVVEDDPGDAEDKNDLGVTASGTIVLSKDYHKSVAKAWGQEPQ